MSLPTSEGKPLIPAHRIRHYGPKRLAPMQGQRLDPKTRLWVPKFKKKSPDSVDRRKLLERVASESKRPPPAEQKKFDLRTYRPLPGKVLLQVGKTIRSQKGVLMPEALEWKDQSFVVVKLGSPAPFRIGDTVFLDAGTHKRPVSFVKHPDMVLVKIRRVGAVVSR